MQSQTYGQEIDMWSIGCTMAEMYFCEPIWKGKDAKHQIDLILQTLGAPTAEEVSTHLVPPPPPGTVSSLGVRCHIRDLCGFHCTQKADWLLFFCFCTWATGWGWDCHFFLPRFDRSKPKVRPHFKPHF